MTEFPPLPPINWWASAAVAVVGLAFLFYDSIRRRIVRDLKRRENAGSEAGRYDP